MNLGGKYRPGRFSDVLGQAGTVRILKKACSSGDLSTGYIFSGTRGVGKTTVARIVAKAVNCDNPVDGEPCCQCPSCRMVAAGNHMDVIELDAASNRGIGDIRALKETIGNAPMEGRVKVYIIDEAHMLTKEAFNALLKTLEEPPPRVAFILATTEPHKIIDTIRSRCQNYSFSPMPATVLIGHLADICRKEGVAADPEAIALIARKAKGSVRDGMSLLGQAIQSSGDTVTLGDTRSALGLASSDDLVSLVESIVSGDVAKTLELSRAMLDQGIDVGQMTGDLAECFRTMYLSLSAGMDVAAGLSGLERDEITPLADAAALSSPERMHLCWAMAMESRRGITGSNDPWLDLQFLLVNMAKSDDLVRLPDLEPQAGNDDAVDAAKRKFGAA